MLRETNRIMYNYKYVHVMHTEKTIGYIETRVSVTMSF